MNFQDLRLKILEFANDPRCKVKKCPNFEREGKDGETIAVYDIERGDPWVKFKDENDYLEKVRSGRKCRCEGVCICARIQFSFWFEDFEVHITNQHSETPWIEFKLTQQDKIVVDQLCQELDRIIEQREEQQRGTDSKNKLNSLFDSLSNL